MTLKTSKPALVGAGSGNVICLAARDSSEFSSHQPDFQASRAVSVLARRHRLSLPTAAVVASLSGFGGAR